MKYFIPFIFFATSILISCTQKATNTYQYASTNVDGWNSNNYLTFPIDTLTDTDHYELSIGLRTSATKPYPFQTLALKVNLYTDSQTIQYCDTVYCRLTTKRGDINGNGVSLYQYEFPFDTIQLNKGTKGHFTIQHIMRRTHITGIANVGIRLKCLNANNTDS